MQAGLGCVRACKCFVWQSKHIAYRAGSGRPACRGGLRRDAVGECGTGVAMVVCIALGLTGAA
jgi:hypothetical protein